MRFFKNGCNGGDGKFLLEMGGGKDGEGEGGWFYNGGMGNF